MPSEASSFSRTVTNNNDNNPVTVEDIAHHQQQIGLISSRPYLTSSNSVSTNNRLLSNNQLIRSQQAQQQQNDTDFVNKDTLKCQNMSLLWGDGSLSSLNQNSQLAVSTNASQVLNPNNIFYQQHNTDSHQQSHHGAIKYPENGQDSLSDFVTFVCQENESNNQVFFFRQIFFN